ncbi:hypothetical protein IKI14_04350 [bacterium]|nr:hypothetical protein [bacterium]
MALSLYQYFIENQIFLEGFCLPLSRGNVACDKGVKIPMPSASPFKKGEQTKRIVM